MGKKKRINRLITKWIKSDLPEDRTTVLLLGVNRIPTSPTPARRPSSLPLGANNPSFAPNLKTNPARNSKHRNSTTTLKNEPVASATPECDTNLSFREGCASSCSTYTTPSICVSHESSQAAAMDRSVDSIGACSLDVDASVELPEWSEASSVGTLRSGSAPTPPETRLPSYLSLACTVNGYSTTTNYDPERLARSRDTSPHRLHDHDHQPITYSIHNNLLSPPNLVPLPTQSFQSKPRTDSTMADQTISTHHRQEFYTSSKTMTYISKESSHNFSSALFSSDTVDACHGNIQNKCVTYESTLARSNQSKCVSESIEFTNGNENKSFIQQRVERLYGPGALAHGFFVMKRQKNMSFDMGKDTKRTEIDNHSKSMLDTACDDDDSIENPIKQSTSTPTLPVLKLLRPEFRAQLPIVTNKKTPEKTMPKSTTIPIIKEDRNLNGHSAEEAINLNGNSETMKNDVKNKTEEKDGHYFLEILEKENDRLLVLADTAEKYLKIPDLPEEAKGVLRSASGKARLLVSQKMQQFKGLCTKNITQAAGEAFPTTSEDLQGFWDMVMLQVDQIDNLFKDIKDLKENNWIEKPVEPDSVKTKTNGTNRVKKVVRSKPNPEAEQARKQREAQRKQLMEARKKAMREQKQQQNASQKSIEIFVPESS